MPNLLDYNLTMFPARFAVSLHPEVFYALQLLEDRESRAQPAWKARAAAALVRGRGRHPTSLPAGLWPALADVLEIGPTEDFTAIVSALGAVPARALQERLLAGVFHHDEAVRELLDGGADLTRVVSAVPRAKREWLAFIGLFPLDPRSRGARALRSSIRSPEAFRARVVEDLQRLWSAVFEDTWHALRPAFAASVAGKERLYRTRPFDEFARHALLPVEVDAERGVLRAVRGGYELALADVAACTFTPSVFNDRRHWTVYPAAGRHAPWFPYFEPGIAPPGESAASASPRLAAPAHDAALILRALGDTTRFALVCLLGRKPRTAARLAELLSVSRATVSHHVHVLRTAGLIHETEHGGSVLLSLDRAVFENLSRLTVARVFESREPVPQEKSRRTR